MRILICGSRTWNDRKTIMQVVAQFPEGSTVIHGCARGADQMAGNAAWSYGLKVEEYPADWELHGPAAGPIRNQQMIDEGWPDLVIAFRCNGTSRGTDDMIRRARKADIPVQIIEGVAAS